MLDAYNVRNIAVCNYVAILIQEANYAGFLVPLY